MPKLNPDTKLLLSLALGAGTIIIFIGYTGTHLLPQTTTGNVNQIPGGTPSNENSQQTNPLINPNPPTGARIAPDKLYPDPKLTQGKADTLNLSDLTATYTDNCPSGKTQCTYSQDHRNVPTSEHDQVYNEYNVPQDQRNIQNGEVDHFYPLCGGGSNDISNLWYQPVNNLWNGQNYGFKTKDKLETWVCVQIKAGKLDPKDAFQKITSDWVKFYLDNFQEISKVQTFGQ